MPLRNRVTPLGDLVADPERGPRVREPRLPARRRRADPASVAGEALDRLPARVPRPAPRPLLRPGRFTELFFLDEATALAAGHRPCAECRREDYDRFASFWRSSHGEAGADAIDARLHDERVDAAIRTAPAHDAALDDLPDGAFVLRDGVPWLVLGDALLAWSAAGYVARAPRPGGRATLITPPSLVAALGTNGRRRCRWPTRARRGDRDRPPPASLLPLRRGVDRSIRLHRLVDRPLRGGQDHDRSRRRGRARAARPARRGPRRRRRSHAPLEGLGFSHEDRDTNIERIGWVASRLTRHGAAVVVAAISPYDGTRKRVRALVSSRGRSSRCGSRPRWRSARGGT